MSAFALMITVLCGAAGYSLYARRIDRNTLRTDRRKATPAVLYHDGVDFVPTTRGVLFGYQFKSIAALGPIVGPIVAAQWGWLPALAWLILGVFFIGWVQDYAGTLMAMRNEGMTMGGLSYRYLSPRARTILLSFIYFYLVLFMGAFSSIVARIMANPDVPIGLVTLTLAGVFAGHMIYKVRRDLRTTTILTVALALVGVWVGTTGVNGVVKLINGAVGYTAVIDGQTVPNILYTTPYGPMTWPVWLWGILALVFCYFGSILPIWQFAQPVNYISFWLIFIGIIGAVLGVVIQHPGFADFPAFTGFMARGVLAPGVDTPLWPILFVTISCGAVSGWHSLVSTTGTARQLEKETDALPVAGGAMFTETVLGVLSLVFAAAAFGSFGGYKLVLAQGAGAVFAGGMAHFLHVLGIPEALGGAFGAVFLTIMGLTVMQLVLRFMRIASAELLGDAVPAFRNPHIGSIVALLFTLLILWTGFWQRIWILFGGSNQLFAGLTLMLVTVWLAGAGKSYKWAFWPGVFMYVTTVAALLVTAHASLQAALKPGLMSAFVFGNLLSAAIGLVLAILALILAVDVIGAFAQARQRKVAMRESPAAV
jgi:carbon starvation protein